MRRDGKTTTMGFLCTNCLRSEESTVPTTIDVFKDVDAIERNLTEGGWRIVKDFPYIRYYCPKCAQAARDDSMRIEKRKMQRIMES